MHHYNFMLCKHCGYSTHISHWSINCFTAINCPHCNQLTNLKDFQGTDWLHREKLVNILKNKSEDFRLVLTSVEGYFLTKKFVNGRMDEQNFMLEAFDLFLQWQRNK